MSCPSYAIIPPCSSGGVQEGSGNNMLGEQIWPTPEEVFRQNGDCLPDNHLLEASKEAQPHINFKTKASIVLNRDEMICMENGGSAEAGLFMNAENVENELASTVTDRLCYGLFPSHDGRAVRDQLLHLVLHDGKACMLEGYLAFLDTSSNSGYMSDVDVFELPNGKAAGPLLETDWRRHEIKDLDVSVRNATQYQSSIHLSANDKPGSDSGVVHNGGVDPQTTLSSIDHMETEIVPGSTPLDQYLHSQIDTVEESLVAASVQPESIGSPESYSRGSRSTDYNEYAAVSDIMDHFDSIGSDHSVDSDIESVITIESDTGSVHHIETN